MRRAKICLAAWVGEYHFVDGLFVTLQTVIIHNARMFGGPFTLSKVSIVDIAIELNIISIYCFINVACAWCASHKVIFPARIFIPKSVITSRIRAFLQILAGYMRGLIDGFVREIPLVYGYNFLCLAWAKRCDDIPLSSQEMRATFASTEAGNGCIKLILALIAFAI